MEKSKFKNYQSNKLTSLSTLIKSPKSEIVLSEPNYPINSVNNNSGSLVNSSSNKRFNFVNKKLNNIIDPDNTGVLSKLSQPVKVTNIDNKIRKILSPAPRIRYNAPDFSNLNKGGKY